ncbi:AraC family ligand binding domain-containing protein [Rhizobiaceae sp. 2RAB30]
MTQVNSMTFALPRSDLLHVRATARSFALHLHSTFSVVILKSGSASVQSSRWSKIVRAGDIFFFNPFEVHAASSSADPAKYETLYPSTTFLDGCMSATT